MKQSIHDGVRIVGGCIHVPLRLDVLHGAGTVTFFHHAGPASSYVAGFRVGGGGGLGGNRDTGKLKNEAMWHTTGHGNTAADRPEPASAEDKQQRSQCSVRGRQSQLAGSMSWSNSATHHLQECAPGICCAVFCCRHTVGTQVLDRTWQSLNTFLPPKISTKISPEWAQ